MRLMLVVVLTLFSNALWAEDCHLVIRADDFSRDVANGQEVLSVAVEDVNEKCFYPAETAKLIKQLQQDSEDQINLAEAYRKNFEALAEQNKQYSQLIMQHEKTLDKSISLSEEFRIEAENYSKLNKDYEQLVVKFDDLAGEYRDVALSAGSPLSVEVGAGFTNDGDGVALIGGGVNVYKSWDVKAWGLFHKDFGAILGGASFRF